MQLTSSVIASPRVSPSVSPRINSAKQSCFTCSVYVSEIVSSPAGLLAMTVLFGHGGLLRRVDERRPPLAPAGGVAIGPGDAVDHRLVERTAGDLHGERDALLGEAGRHR